jgi:hypothetical protein
VSKEVRLYLPTFTATAEMAAISRMFGSGFAPARETRAERLCRDGRECRPLPPSGPIVTLPTGEQPG